jgi:hypothetical protein
VNRKAGEGISLYSHEMKELRQIFTSIFNLYLGGTRVEVEKLVAQVKHRLT